MANFGAMIRSYIQEKKPAFDIDRLKRFATQQATPETQDKIRSFGEMAMYNPLQPFVEKQYEKYIQSPEGEMFPQRKYSEFAKQDPYIEKALSGERLTDKEMVEMAKLQSQQALVMGPLVGMTAPQAIGPGTRAALMRLTAQQKSGLSDVAYYNTVESGGITINVKGQQPTEGYAYSVMKGEEKVIPGKQFKPNQVTKYISKNAKTLKQPGNHLGIWEEGGKVYLDISKVGTPTKQTLKAATKAQQLAVFDLKNFKDIVLGSIIKGKYIPRIR